MDDSNSVVSQRLDERHQHCKDLETTLGPDPSDPRDPRDLQVDVLGFRVQG